MATRRLRSVYVRDDYSFYQQSGFVATAFTTLGTTGAMYLVNQSQRSESLFIFRVVLVATATQNLQLGVVNSWGTGTAISPHTVNGLDPRTAPFALSWTTSPGAVTLGNPFYFSNSTLGYEIIGPISMGPICIVPPGFALAIASTLSSASNFGATVWGTSIADDIAPPQ